MTRLGGGTAASERQRAVRGPSASGQVMVAGLFMMRWDRCCGSDALGNRVIGGGARRSTGIAWPTDARIVTLSSAFAVRYSTVEAGEIRHPRPLITNSWTLK